MTGLRYRYQTIEFGDFDIHLRTLRDKQQFEDTDGVSEKLGISSATWPLFGVVWQSSEILARLMLDFDIKGKRILEIGCGVGLPSLLLNHRNADITSTDYHPQVQRFLDWNVMLNGDSKIPFERTGWADNESGLGKFDLLVGSDILYERNHAQLLVEFINQHARPRCEVIIVDPGRGNHARFSKQMLMQGYHYCQSVPYPDCQLDPPFKGRILRFQRKATDINAPNTK